MNNQQKIWKTREGIEWKLKDMTDSHVLNCLVALKNRKIYPNSAKYRQKWIIIFTNEIRLRKYNKLGL